MDRESGSAVLPPVPFLGVRSMPEGVAWTPLEHRCGCVVEWGWEGTTSNPLAFMSFCAVAVESACPWHGAESGRPISSPRWQVLDMHNPQDGTSFYARMAEADDVQLGREITRQLRSLLTLVDRHDRQAIIAQMPPVLVAGYSRKGYDPVHAWVQGRMTDLLLNRGADTQGHLAALLEHEGRH